MTIEKGAPWGEPGCRGPATPVYGSDHELAAAAAAALDRGEHLEAAVAAGDVLANLGVGAERAPSEQHRYIFDLGFVSLDGGPAVPFVAHVLAHRRFWAGDFAVVMNVGWLGSWYLGPRAHPNDGLLDVTAGRLDLRQRALARKRARTGTHLPHPDLSTHRSPRWQGLFEHPVRVIADDRTIGTATAIEAWIVPDGLTVIV